MSVPNRSSPLWRRVGNNLIEQTPLLGNAIATGLWRSLRHPMLAFILALLAGALVLAANLLPQLPGQLRDEPATAARWLLSASSAHGFWGSLWLGLGLYDVLHSPLTALLGVVLALALSAHLAAQLAAIRQIRAAQAALHQPPREVGAPISLPSAPGLLRSRLTTPAPPEHTDDEVQAQVALRFTHVEAVTLSIQGTVADGEELTPQEERRHLATTGEVVLWLRLLLPMGLLLALGAVWSAVAFGWQVTTPPLAPGEVFRAVNQHLQLTYQVPAPEQGDTGSIVVEIGEARTAFSTARAQRGRVGGAAVNIQPIYPGVLVQMDDGAAELARPGGSERVAQVGIVIPDRGGEESVLLPKYGAGLRIVQQSTDLNAFILELYRSRAVEPVYRAELTPSGRVTVPLEETQTAIIVTNMPGLQVDVRHEPGVWLAWIGLAAALLGLMAVLRRAGFVLVQLAPWPPQRTLVVVQSSLPREQARLLDRLNANPRQRKEPDVQQ